MTDSRSETPPPSTRAYFVLAFAITWLSLTPLLLAQHGLVAGPAERFLPLSLPAIFGPLLAAVIASGLEGGRAAVRALFARARRWRVGVVWYVVALGGFAFMHVCGVAVARALGVQDAGQWLYLPENPQHVAAMLLVPIGEEVGWRGFALPRLQQRFTPGVAAAILGVLWAAWHLPMLLSVGQGPGLIALGMLHVAVGNVIFSWIYNRTQGSLLLAILAHVGVHLDNTTRALPASATPFVINLLAVCATVSLLLVVERRLWRAPPTPGT